MAAGSGLGEAARGGGSGLPAAAAGEATGGGDGDDAGGRRRCRRRRRGEERREGVFKEGGRRCLGKGAPEAAVASVPGTDSGGGGFVREEERPRAGRRLGLWPSRRGRVFFNKFHGK